MKIILEGPDGSGKSTLADAIAKLTGFQIKRGEGPEKFPGEITERAQRWNFMTFRDPAPLIFDRHPCISHPIYSQFTPVTKLDLGTLQSFRDGLKTDRVKILIVYCKGHTLEGHTEKEYDSEDHVSAITKNHSNICMLYDYWADQIPVARYDRTKNDVNNSAEMIAKWINR